jgi:hypothetical protein
MAHQIVTTYIEKTKTPKFSILTPVIDIEIGNGGAFA